MILATMQASDHTRCFFSHDISAAHDKIVSVAATFHFSPQAIGELEISDVPLYGLDYWYDAAKQIDNKINPRGQNV